MSSGVLKQVELTKTVDDLTEVPYLNLGQEIQSKKNLVRYYKLLSRVKSCLAGDDGFKNTCPLTNSSYINILVDSPDEDYSSPKFLTFHATQQKLARFGTDIDQEMLMIEQEFTRIIKRIRSELGIEGDDLGKISMRSLGLGTDDTVIKTLIPREPKGFIASLETLFAAPSPEAPRPGRSPLKYPIDLPYFRS